MALLAVRGVGLAQFLTLLVETLLEIAVFELLQGEGLGDPQFDLGNPGWLVLDLPGEVRRVLVNFCESAVHI